MLVSRRLALGSALAVPTLLAGCSTGSRASGEGSSSGAEPGRRRTTSLGVVEIHGDPTGAWNDRLAEAAQRVRTVWGVAPRSLALTFCATDEEFEASSAGLGDLTAAVTTPGGIYVGPNVQNGLDRTGQVVVLAHELVHACLGHVGHDPTALWVREGAAEWTAERGVALSAERLWPTVTARVRSGTSPAEPPGRGQFDSDAALAYETSTAYAAYLVETTGTAAWKTFVRSRPPERQAVAEAQDLLGHSGKSFTVWLRERVSS